MEEASETEFQIKICELIVILRLQILFSHY